MDYPGKASEVMLAKNTVFHVPPGLADGFGGKLTPTG
jgi:hypothetical protein